MRKTPRAGTARSTLGGAAALVLAATGLAPATQAATPPAVPTAPESATGTAGAGADVSVTLVTGDTVHLTEAGDGRRALQLEHGEGREDVAVHQLEIDGELHVLPMDALPYVADGVLDQDLFNVDQLIEQGFDDASTDSLPLITTYAEGRLAASATSALGTLAAVEPGVELESIDARAVDVDKDGVDIFWSTVTGVPAVEAAASAAAEAEPEYTASVEKVWLDAPVHATLDRSTEQIGAPTAWEAGIDGTGVTVAVLDTGVDAEHPDLAGRVAQHQDFSNSGNVLDHVGHGTHVAATVAGTGAGSDGSRKGVAPGATVLSGKVLGDNGTGGTSGVIAGMEWAVAEGADVVNMSLGGGPTDGTDPLSQAVNSLSAESDTLFVISAGNDGPGASTIGSPGSADAALTVGAVDRDESIADFSSRGPRLGDLAVKPDLTAPGVGIVAARAAGTGMGSPVNDLYTAASGTSMAAPHVAGAAALLAAQHPDWDGEQLKDALVSTALPGDLTAYQQGGGRVDQTRAVTQSVTATGSVHLGTFEDEDTEPAGYDVTYTNGGDADVDLALHLDVTDLGGEVPADGGLTLSADTVTVPAGGTATVTVTVDPAVLERGQYTGTLEATSGDVTVHTTLAVIKVAPTHEVTFRGVGFDGESSFVTPLVLLGEDPRFDSLGFINEGGTRTFTLGEGDYFLHAMMTPEVDGQDAAVVVTDPDLEVTGDMEVVLDARDATRVRVETPQPAATRGNLGFTTYRAFHGRTLANSTMEFDVTQSVWVTPTEEAKGGEFEFASRWQLGAPPLIGSAVEGEPLEVWPRYERYSPALAPEAPLELVDAGAGTPEDYAGLDVEGKVAVVSLTGKGQEDVDAAVAAGAAALMIAPDGTQWWTKFTGRGFRLDLPVVVLSPAEGQEVLARLAAGPLSLELSGDQDPAYTYDVMQVSRGRVPEQVVYSVSDANSATVTADYHEMGGEEWAKEQRFAWRPWQQNTIVETQQELHTPQTRTEVVSANDTLWRQHVLHYFSWDTLNPISGGAVQPIRTYQPGEQVAYDWYRAVIRPTVVPGQDPARTEDRLSLRIAEMGMQAGELFQRAPGRETTMSLYEDGQLLVEDDQAWGEYPVTKAEAQYRLDLSVERASDSQWDFSTRTDTSWTFGSARPAEGAAVLPLLQADYAVPVGTDNTVPGGSSEPVRISVGHPAGLEDAPRIRNARAWSSLDDGQTWHRLPLRPTGNGEFRTVVVHPRDGGHVSLRLEATDLAGNTVEQTVIRAYGVTAR